MYTLANSIEPQARRDYNTPFIDTRISSVPRGSTGPQKTAPLTAPAPPFPTSTLAPNHRHGHLDLPRNDIHTHTLPPTIVRKHAHPDDADRREAHLPVTVLAHARARRWSTRRRQRQTGVLALGARWGQFGRSGVRGRNVQSVRVHHRDRDATTHCRTYAPRGSASSTTKPAVGSNAPPATMPLH